MAGSMGLLPLEKYIMKTLIGLCWGWGGAGESSSLYPSKGRRKKRAFPFFEMKNNLLRKRKVGGDTRQLSCWRFISGPLGRKRAALSTLERACGPLRRGELGSWPHSFFSISCKAGGVGAYSHRSAPGQLSLAPVDLSRTHILAHSSHTGLHCVPGFLPLPIPMLMCPPPHLISFRPSSNLISGEALTDHHQLTWRPLRVPYQLPFCYLSFHACFFNIYFLKYV